MVHQGLKVLRFTNIIKSKYNITHMNSSKSQIEKGRANCLDRSRGGGGGSLCVF